MMVFIYNAYGLWMSVRTDWNKEMYGLHQLPEGEVELIDTYSLNTTLRELREEIDFLIHSFITG